MKPQRFLAATTAADTVSLCAHVKVAAKKYDLQAVDILVELSRRRVAGRLEDMIVAVALEMQKAHGNVRV